MPQSLSIAAFVFGSVLILLSLVVGKFKIFGAEVEGTVGKSGRIVAFFFGIFLIGTGMNLDGSHPRPPVSDGQKVEDTRDASVGGSPPPQSQSRSVSQQSFDHFIHGEWEARAADPSSGAVSDTVMRFHGDGTFTGRTSGLVNGYPVTVPISGTWSTRPAAADRFRLTVNYVGTGGTQSYTFRVLDNNSIENEEMNYVAHRLSD